MIPANITFHGGFTINPLDILRPRKVSSGAIPAEWPRVRFRVPTGAPLYNLDNWIIANLLGRYTLYILPGEGGESICVLAFETSMDAVMFRLKGGERAWQEIEVDG